MGRWIGGWKGDLGVCVGVVREAQSGSGRRSGTLCRTYM